jgi:hypothetical protein
MPKIGNSQLKFGYISWDDNFIGIPNADKESVMPVKRDDEGGGNIGGIFFDPKTEHWYGIKSTDIVQFQELEIDEAVMIPPKLETENPIMATPISEPVVVNPKAEAPEQGKKGGK